jgi:hypothetical protein
MINEVAQAILTKFNETPAGDTLRAALTGGLFFMEAGRTVSFPYGVFTWDGSSIEETAGDRTNGIETASITVKLYTKSDDGSALLFTIEQLFIELYDWATLTYPGSEYKHLAIQRTGEINRGKIDNVWEIDLFYDVMFEH